MELHEIDALLFGLHEAKTDNERYAIIFNLCIIGGLSRNTTRIKVDFNRAIRPIPLCLENIFTIVKNIQKYEFNIEFLSVLDWWYSDQVMEPSTGSN